LPVLSHITCLNYRSGDPRTNPLGSIYLIGRFYDPATRQFLSVDPKFEQTLQAYFSVRDDPMNDVNTCVPRACVRLDACPHMDVSRSMFRTRRR